MKTWFLPPDFTFTPTGSLQLGTVIPHPRKPTNVLASPRTDPISLPDEDEVLIEANHSHSNEANHKAGIGLLAQFAGFASGSLDYERNRRNVYHYGNVDHEIRSLVTPFSKDFLTSIGSLDNVKQHMYSGILGRRPVYVVTGLRITRSSFTVTKEIGSENSAGISATGPVGGVVPVEAGGSLSGGFGNNQTDSWETAPGIVFAYRLHVIRPKGHSFQQEMFASDRADLATGQPKARVFSEVETITIGEPEEESEPMENEPMEIAEVTSQVLVDDVEEDIRFAEEEVGVDDSFVQLLS